MRFTTLAICSSLIVAAASAHVSSPDVGSSASSSSSLLARSDAVTASVSSSVTTNLSLQKRDDLDSAEGEEDDDGEGDDEEESDDLSSENLETRRKHHKHPHSHHHQHQHQHHPHHRSKKHGKTVHAVSTSGTFRGKGTFFQPNQGACGKWNTANDKIVALSSDVYRGGRHCFQEVKICHSGRCANARVADLCPGCRRTSLDMTPSLFKELADPSIGVIDIQWTFV